MRKLNFLAAAFAAAVLASAPAAANTVLFDLNFNFGTVSAQGDVTVSVSDAGNGNVNVTVHNGTAGFLNDLFLNYSPSSDLATAAITNFSGGSITQPSIQFNGAQGFAIIFDFQNANNDPGRFLSGDTVSFTIDANVDLLADNFNTLGGGPVGDDYYAVAHINAIPATGNCPGGSGKVGDRNGGNVAGGGGSSTDVCVPLQQAPEPGSLALVGIAFSGLGLVRARRRRG